MRKLVIMAAALALAPGAANASTFINGSFESGATPGSFITVAPGDTTSITGWFVTSGDVDYIGSYWTSGDGARSVDLSGFGAGTLAQTFDTIAGQTYNVSFLLAGNPDGGPGMKTVNVFATGGATQSYSFDSTGKSAGAMGWMQFGYAFVATGSVTTLSFASTTGTRFGPALDGVSVSVVPEPAVWAMLIIGFSAIGGRLRRRRVRVRYTAA